MSEKQSDPTALDPTLASATETAESGPAATTNVNPKAVEITAKDDAKATEATAEGTDETATPMSKNQMKKLKRKLAWEQGAEDRKRQRREKQKQRKERRRAENAALTAKAIADGIDPATLFPKTQRRNPVKVPVSLIIDCDFEQYMTEKELISLSSQVTRSYSENKKANFRTHLVLSSWKGKLRERYETVFADQFKYWKDVTFVEGGFEAAAAQIKEVMAGPGGGSVIDTLQTPESGEPAMHVEDGAELTSENDETGYRDDVVYLSSDSPYVIERLEPGTSYVIGGIVDKNREKGLCYKIAREHKVRTAKLPIGEYMVMQSRQVLTTNQVVEIMLKWLELGDWGKAFLSVIPKRKGGRLKGDETEEGEEERGEADEEGQGKEDGDGEQEAEKTEEEALNEVANDAKAEEADETSAAGKIAT
ncbi:hypothetical protein TD95_003599 [Thielaviopsis punctulata]|uniref:tRNA (guanine(9)-N1)-methyltransferase n=1 Tax=Thielaviopsis punctulata TaxID=72032 RepID=A0A0F4Z774_9PEZI|nr:hypothetical protein TD95_003599 [Thielaviopsis punctulata]